ncbi:hypothetical protein AVEN_3137-1 [Araneus ventricosus]|uniref:DDE-1 domain-containing protein n=1 Tax=Araneus ventricosus TaxID=182803 RepID=A0A4Y2JT29_ARAVE|nr:hypothetical protein AVEN_3137-1 [Araneus ventricosus]
MKIRNSIYPEVEECVRKWITKHVFNADETRLFFQRLPNKTVAFKGEECHGGKQGKIRVTVLLPANQSGKEKLPPLMLDDPKCRDALLKLSHFE